jgi:BirA family biotin operon repressor/biotin-[acetyl-CoA-carboxylase] ligase
MRLVIHRSLASTQDEAFRLIQDGAPAAVAALEQTAGRGRWGRTWHSEPGSSLALSIPLLDEADHPEPWLIGMGLAVQAAGAFHLQLQWPNDLVIKGRKAGGILVEIRNGAAAAGIGLNLRVESFPPELAERAVSLHESRPNPPGPAAAARTLCRRLEGWRAPRSWSELRTAWMEFDSTPGKRFTTADGRTVEALGIGPGAELIASADGETLSIRAAEAHWGAVR